MNQKITVLIDGNNILHRAHWVSQNTGSKLITSTGRDVGSIFGFLKSVKMYSEQFNADEVYVCWDLKLTPKPNFRQELTGGLYKGNRDQERNDQVYEGIGEIVRISKYLNIKNMFPGQLEADDVISWLTKNLPDKKIIVSGDKDFLQLVSDDVSYYSVTKKLNISVANFEEVIGVPLKSFLYSKAIIGDQSDNLPGITGYGAKKGLKLAEAYAKYKANELNSEKDIAVIEEHIDLIEKNLKLMDLTYGISNHQEEVELYHKQKRVLDKAVPDFAKFKEACEDLEFNSIIKQINNWQAVFNKQHNNNILSDYFAAFK